MQPSVKRGHSTLYEHTNPGSTHTYCTHLIQHQYVASQSPACRHHLCKAQAQCQRHTLLLTARQLTYAALHQGATSTCGVRQKKT